MPRPTARANQADRHVAQRIRERRVLLGLTQDQLARDLGITYQQMHKYERGVNRVSASRLYEIAEALRVPVTYFYEGIDEPPHGRTLNPRERLTLEVVRSVAAIADPRLQEVLGNLARSLAAPPPTGEADDAAEETPDRKRGAAL